MQSTVYLYIYVASNHYLFTMARFRGYRYRFFFKQNEGHYQSTVCQTMEIFDTFQAFKSVETTTTTNNMYIDHQTRTSQRLQSFITYQQESLAVRKRSVFVSAVSAALKGPPALWLVASCMWANRKVGKALWGQTQQGTITSTFHLPKCFAEKEPRIGQKEWERERQIPEKDRGREWKRKTDRQKKKDRKKAICSWTKLFYIFTTSHDLPLDQVTKLPKECIWILHFWL